jgi:hypothetical protein
LRDLDGGGRQSLSRLLLHLTGQDLSPAYGATRQQVEDAIAKWSAAAEQRR